jgi:hypothetical protein
MSFATLILSVVCDIVGLVLQSGVLHFIFIMNIVAIQHVQQLYTLDFRTFPYVVGNRLDYGLRVLVYKTLENTRVSFNIHEDFVLSTE